MIAMPEPDRAVLGRRVEIVQALRRLVPGEGVIDHERELRAFESDGLTAYRQPPMVAVHGQPASAPCVLISGGETTVTVRGRGRGGRNVEFLLSMAVELDGRSRIFAIAGDTDGTDGAEEVAGAIVTPGSLARASQFGLNARALLADNDAHNFFRALGDQVITGPTLTNVNDFRAVLINPE